MDINVRTTDVKPKRNIKLFLIALINTNDVPNCVCNQSEKKPERKLNTASILLLQTEVMNKMDSKENQHFNSRATQTLQHNRGRNFNFY